MAGKREFELLFKLQATLGDKFKSSFTDAKTATKDLQGTIKNLKDTAGNIDKFKIQEKQLAASTTKTEKYRKELEELQKKYKDTGSSSDELKQKIQQKEVQLEKSEQKVRKETETLKELRDSLDKAGVSTANLSSEHEKLTGAIDKATLKQEKLVKIAKAQEENKKAIAGTKRELLTLGGVAAGATAAVYQTTVKGALEVKKGMTKLYTLVDEGEIPMSQMEKDIRAVSMETGVVMEKLIEDTYGAISAGQDAKDAVGFVLDSTKLSKAGFAESAEALDILTTALNAYGLESEETSRISDILVMTQDLGKTTVGELSQTMGKVIPTAKANKVAMEQLGASYATMTSKGFKTADTTTYLNAMIQELGKTGSKSDKQLRATTGKTFSQLMEEGKNLAEVLEILEGSAKKSGESLGDMFSSSTAKSAALTLLSDGVEGYTKNLEAMNNAEGKTQENYEKVMQDETERMNKARNSIKNLTNAIGSAFLPQVGKMADSVTKVVDKAGIFIENNKELVTWIGKLALGFVGVKGGMLGLKLGFLQVKGGFYDIKTAYEMISDSKIIGGLSKITSGVVAQGGKFTGVLKNIITNTGGAKEAFSMLRGIRPADIFGKMKDLGQGARSGFQSMKDGVLGLKSGFDKLRGIKPSDIIGGIKTAFIGLKNIKVSDILTKISGGMGGIGAKALPIIAAITAIIVVIKLISGNLEEIREKIKNTFGDGALAVFDKVVGVFKSIAEEAKKIIGTETFQKVKQFFESFGEGTPIIEAVRKTLKDLSEVIPPIIDKLVQLGKDVLPKLFSIFGQIANSIVGITQAVLPVLISMISSIIPIISTLIDAVLPVVINLITTILPILQEIAAMALPILTEAITKVAGAIGWIIEHSLPILQSLIEMLVPVIVMVSEVFVSKFHAIAHNVKNITESLTRTLGGIIDFVTGVFTGNWKQAWQGVQDIFGGLFGGLVALAKAPLNLIVGAVNGVIKGLNKVKLPDWVPGIGGKGINIPIIPMLAKGSDNSPGTFIAGEEGPELITGSPGKKVFTALETSNIFGNIKQAAATARSLALGGIGGSRQELAVAGAPSLNLASTGGKVIKIEHSPVFHVTNGDPKEIEEALKKSNEELKREIKDELREEREDERRTKYD